MLKLIDAETKGNRIRLYFGEQDDNTGEWVGAAEPGEQPYGDDWDDAPYEHNAGLVYERFIRYTVDAYVKWDYGVFEPNDGYLNSPFTREGLFKDKAPIIYIKTSEPYWLTKDGRENDPNVVCLCMQQDIASVIDKISAVQDKAPKVRKFVV